MASLGSIRAPSGSYVPMGFRSVGGSSGDARRGLRGIDLSRFLRNGGAGTGESGISYMGGSRNFDERTGTYRGGRLPRRGGGDPAVNGTLGTTGATNPMLQRILDQLRQVQQPAPRGPTYTADFDRLAQGFLSGPVTADTYGRTAGSRDEILRGYSPEQLAAINQRYYGGALDSSSADALIAQLRRNDAAEYANRGWNAPAADAAPTTRPIDPGATMTASPTPNMPTTAPPDPGATMTASPPPNAPTTRPIAPGPTMTASPSPTPPPEQPKRPPVEETFGGGPDHARGGPIRWPRPMAVGGSVRPPSMRSMSATGRVTFPSISDFLGRPSRSARRGRQAISSSLPVDLNDPLPPSPPPTTPPPPTGDDPMAARGGSDGGDVADDRGQGRDQRSFESLSDYFNDPTVQKELKDLSRFAGPFAMFSSAIKEVFGGKSGDEISAEKSVNSMTGGGINPELQGRGRDAPSPEPEVDDAGDTEAGDGVGLAARGGPIAKVRPGGRAEDGGEIEGAGGPTEDQVPINASPDEYMMDAATSRFWTPELLKLMQDVAHGQGDPAELERMFEEELAKATEGRPEPGPVADDEDDVEVDDEGAPASPAAPPKPSALSSMTVARFLPKTR